jgi:hypothetical protein
VTALARIASIVLVEDRVGDERKAYMRSGGRSNAAYHALLLRLFRNYCCAMSDLVYPPVIALAKTMFRVLEHHPLTSHFAVRLAHPHAPANGVDVDALERDDLSVPETGKRRKQEG